MRFSCLSNILNYFKKTLFAFLCTLKKSYNINTVNDVIWALNYSSHHSCILNTDLVSLKTLSLKLNQQFDR